MPAVQAFLAAAQVYVDAALRANRRDDGLYHSYNLLDLRDGAAVGRLQEMLEGQVAVLSSGLLTPAEALELVRALRAQRAVPGGPALLPALPRPRAADVPGAQPDHRGAGRVRAAAGGARRGR